MRIAYFDCFSGVSGDMVLGALLHAGVPITQLQDQLQLLNLKGFTLEAQSIIRGGIKGMRCLVKTDEQHHHRHLPDIERIIKKSGVDDTVKEKSLQVFQRLAEAEGRVHGISSSEVHFHEVGAIDAIVDIVGSMIGLQALGIEKIYSSPLSFGTGTVQSAHGEIPVPAPATVELARGYSIRQTTIPMELTTPTGAAIITTLSHGTQLPLNTTLMGIGYGAGTKELPGLPNFLRLLVLEEQSTLETDSVMLLESTIDDMNPELYPYFMERMLEAGALDVFLTPVIMKKGRPGILLSVLCSDDKLQEIHTIFFSETSTIGVRMSRWDRKKLPREVVTVETPFGSAKFKQVIVQGKKNLIPEFEECRRIARAQNLPLREVYSKLQQIAESFK